MTTRIQSQEGITLVVQSFGRWNEYRRAMLCVLSYAAVTGGRVNDVILFTDRPDVFADAFADLPVRYVLLTPEKIRSMRGQIDFLHRMKIALIEEAFGMTERPLLYVDSDAFFLKDLTPRVVGLSDAEALMHVREYEFGSLRNMPLPAGKPFRAFVELIDSHVFDVPSGTMRVSPEWSSWNAGIMAFHPSHRGLLAEVYQLTDQFFVPTGNHASEQYAFSIVLQNHTRIQPCDDAIYHYWYRVQKQVVDELLERELTFEVMKGSLHERIGVVKNWISGLPALLERHPAIIRDRAIQSLHENQWRKGFGLGLRYLSGKPNDGTFVRDMLYHLRRMLFNIN
ncbi:MAG: hypothetical protein U0V64_13875 [Cyclobacteriaceae bacterium]